MNNNVFYKEPYTENKKEISDIQKDFRNELNIAFEKLNALQKQIAEKKIADLENSLSELEADLNSIIEETAVSR